MFANIKRRNDREREKALSTILAGQTMQPYNHAYVDHHKNCPRCDEQLQPKDGSIFVYTCGCKDVEWHTRISGFGYERRERTKANAKFKWCIVHQEFHEPEDGCDFVE